MNVQRIKIWCTETLRENTRTVLVGIITTTTITIQTGLTLQIFSPNSYLKGKTIIFIIYM